MDTNNNDVDDYSEVGDLDLDKIDMFKMISMAMNIIRGFGKTTEKKITKKRNREVDLTNEIWYLLL